MLLTLSAVAINKKHTPQHKREKKMQNFNVIVFVKLIAFFSLLYAILPSELHAQTQTLCIKQQLSVNAKNKIPHRNALRVVNGSNCPRGFRQLLDTAVFQGPAGETGAQGPAGRDGSLRIYGDESAGVLNVTTSGLLFADYAQDGNLQFTDINISAGSILTVPSGTVLRASGNFNNLGTINVQTAAQGAASITAFSTGILYPANRPPQAGIAGSIAGPGEFGSSAENRFGGLGGPGMTLAEARQIFRVGRLGGGGGSILYSNGDGGDGGGTLTVLAAGNLTNAGEINANGTNGSASAGGGGGGIIILASPTLITQTGTLSATAGAGGAAFSRGAAGGGGGGGLIHLISPSINATGTSAVDGGASGDIGLAGIITNNPRSGGGGGGAGIVSGGNGGTAFSNNNGGSGFSGENGFVITTLANPTALF
jgi:hypothetical protein